MVNHENVRGATHSGLTMGFSVVNLKVNPNPVLVQPALKLTAGSFYHYLGYTEYSRPFRADGIGGSTQVELPN